MTERVLRLVHQGSLYLAIAVAALAPLLVGFGYLSLQQGSFALVSAIVIVILSRIDSVAEMSIGPMRAKMRETISEAEKIMEQLRATTRVIAKMMVGKSTMGNFWLGNVPPRQQFEMYDDLVEQMGRLGFSADEISDVAQGWKAGINLMYVGIILDKLQSVDADGRMSPNQPEAISRLVEEINLGFNNATQTHLPPKLLRKMIERADLLTPEVHLWVEDYDEYTKTGVIRRREEFLNARR